LRHQDPDDAFIVSTDREDEHRSEPVLDAHDEANPTAIAPMRAESSGELDQELGVEADGQRAFLSRVHLRYDRVDVWEDTDLAYRRALKYHTGVRNLDAPIKAEAKLRRSSTGPSSCLERLHGDVPRGVSFLHFARHHDTSAAVGRNEPSAIGVQLNMSEVLAPCLW
jgi:hypothetical protein